MFALCDYYMKGDVCRHSRHIYDIYKLLPMIALDEEFRKLVKDVRVVRAKNINICHSAQPGVDVPAVLMEIIHKEVYKSDYDNVTSRILEEQIPYKVAIEAVSKIAESGLLEEELG